MAGLWGGAGLGAFAGIAHTVLLVYYFGCKKRHLAFEEEEEEEEEFGLSPNEGDGAVWLPGVPGFMAEDGELSEVHTHTHTHTRLLLYLYFVL